MNKEFIINADKLETRIAVLEDKRLAELVIERQETRSIVGNIYRGRVDAIVPGIQAAFIDIGLEKNGFLYVGDIAGAEGTGDFEFVNGTARPSSRSKRAQTLRIEEVLKKNQPIMVQIAKDKLGTKGVRLTNFITIPGRFLVLMPTVRQLGVSRKIGSDKERDRLKKILLSIRDDDVGLISRTACEGCTKSELRADYKYLMRVWERAKRKFEKASKPCLLHEDLGPVLRLMRDSFSRDVSRVIIDNEEAYERVQAFLEQFSDGMNKRCRHYRSKRPIFEKMGVEQEIEKALRRKVYLKSGGYICIDQTEALVAIDVNTGKFTGSKRLEDTVFQTNMDAAEEIARQVRLRDMGGIIVCDFIDMRYDRNRRDLLRKLRECLKQDRARTTVSEVSELGLIEMTRKRVKHNLMTALSQPCPYCEGSGMVKSVTTMTFDTLRRIQNLFCRSKEKRVIVQVHPDVARRLRNENKRDLDDLADEFGREIAVESVSDFHIHDVEVISARTRNPVSASTKES